MTRYKRTLALDTEAVSGGLFRGVHQEPVQEHPPSRKCRRVNCRQGSPIIPIHQSCERRAFRANKSNSDIVDRNHPFRPSGYLVSSHSTASQSLDAAPRCVPYGFESQARRNRRQP